MTEKLPRIYTRAGDGGETGLFDGARVSKADPRVEAYGDIDELASLIGVIHAEGLDAGLAAMAERLERDLFAIGAILADPRHRIAARVQKVAFAAEDVTRLEGWIDELEAGLPPLRRFILPGGGRAGALLHYARTVCRRAERRIVSLGPGATAEHVIPYINRLSDLLFVMARASNARAGISEIEW